MIRKWYLDAYVNYTNATAVPSANVSVFNSSNAMVNSSLTNSTGWIPRAEITQYVNNGGAYTYANNHTIYANLSGFVNASISWAIGNGTSGTYGDGTWGDIGNNTRLTLTLANSTIPSLYLFSPNASYYNTTPLNILYIASGLGLDKVWYNYTTGNSTPLTGNTSITGTEGSNNITLWANASDSSQNHTTPFTVSIDTQPPNTTIDNTTATIPYSSSIAIQGTCIDQGIAGLDSAYTNSSYFATPDSTIATSFNLTNTSGIPDGSVTVYVFCNDSYGNNANSASLTFILDTVAPALGITAPNNGTFHNASGVTIAGGCTDATAAYTNSTVWSGIDATPSSFSYANASTLASDTMYSVMIYCNDSANNTASASVTFTYDGTLPNAGITSPATGRYYGTAQAIAGTCSDTYINTSYTNSSYYAGVDTSPASFSFANTSSIPDGSLSVRVYCNDSANNTNSTYTYYILDSAKPYWSGNLTNASSSSTKKGDTVYFNVTWNDAIVGNYSTFSWNDSGSWVNETLIIGSASNKSSVIRVVTSTAGKQVSWRWYANDSANNWNTTDVWSFVVYSTAPVVNAVNASPVIQGFGQNATIWANVTDIDGQSDIHTLWAQVTTPLGATSNLTLSNTGTYLWKGNYTLGFTNGTYNVTVWANDTSNFYAATNTTSFQGWILPSVSLYANQTSYNPSQSVSLISSNITNGATEASYYLLMKVQYWSGTGWGDEATIQDDTTARYIAPSAVLDFGTLWNATGWNVSTRTHGDGTYRAYVSLTNASDGLLYNRSGDALEFGYNFSITNPAPTIASIMTYKGGAEVNKFMANEVMEVRANVTDINGKTDIVGVLVSVRRPTGAFNLTNASMSSMADITNGSTYTYSYTLPADANDGTWTIQVYAYDKEGLYTASSASARVILGHSIQLSLQVPGTSGLVAMGTNKEAAASSMSNTSSTFPSHYYITSSGNGTVRGIVFVEKDPISIDFGRSGTSAHTLMLDEYLTGASDLLLFTKGSAADVDKRIKDIESGSFFSQISPSFGYGLGLRYPLKVVVGYTNINITGDLTLNPGYHTVVVENAGTSGGKRVVSIRQA